MNKEQLARIEQLKNAETTDEIREYYKLRNIQIAEIQPGIICSSIQNTPYGALATYMILYRPEDFISIYIKKSLRGQGLYKAWYKKKFSDKTILTIDDCDLEVFLKKTDIPHFIIRKK